MALENEIEKYKFFKGRICEQMPKLIAEGRVPVNTAELMEMRLNVLNSNDRKQILEWWSYISTGDGVVANPYEYGEFKVVLDADYIRKITPSTPVSSTPLGGYGVRLWDGMPRGIETRRVIEEAYCNVQGISVSSYNYCGYNTHNKQISKEDAKCCEVLYALARSGKLLSDYLEAAFSRLGIQNNFSIADRMMPTCDVIGDIVRLYFDNGFELWNCVKGDSIIIGKRLNEEK